MPARKTLVYLCDCGTNIASFLDLDALAQWAGGQDEVMAVERHSLLCSPAGKKHFSNTIRTHQPERVVVAACSPKMHEKTFQALAEEAGLNLARVQMANIREHCAWVTADKVEAAAKARALVHAAVHRVQLAEPLTRRTLKVNTDVVVVGGGVAGMEAALLAANAGRHVTLVDRQISLGGEVIKTEEVAPGMECAPCLLAPRLTAVKESPQITVITNASVTQVLGFCGNFTVRLRKRARTVDDTCIGCEACFEVCPVSVPNAFHLGLGTRKAIYTLFPGSVPAAAAVDREHCRHFVDGSCDACVKACPFGSINFDQKDEDVEVQAGAIVLATGAAAAEPAVLKELGRGTVEDVYTLAEFERLASSNGPSGGQVRRRNGEVPRSVAVIHCAGSRRPDGVPYCSRVCCLQALKVGELLRKKVPEVRVYNIHQDLVLPNPREAAFQHRQTEEGTVLVRTSRIEAVRVERGPTGIEVQGPGFAPLTVDMVVLATGFLPGPETTRLADQLMLELDRSGYFKPDHPFLHATGASLDGVYIAGSAAGPCDVGAAITQAQAAAGHALAKLIPGRELDLEMMTSSIDAEKCAGCKLCLTVCPYKAVSFDHSKGVAVVNEAICRGCGTCTATCPSGASTAKHFTDGQIRAEVGGLLHV